MSEENSQQTVLIVDDTPENIDVIGNILSQDYTVMISTSGLKALEIAETQLPDLILLDVIIPDIDGYEILHRLKNNDRTKDIPVIFVTAKDSIRDEERGLRMGAADYISKPISVPILKHRVANQLKIVSQQKLLQEMCQIDHLTQIANRRQFDSQLYNEWHKAMRTGSPLSLAIIDVDYFKKYNDFYGHAMGDNVLKSIAKTLASYTKRAGDLVARWGGEEFAILSAEPNAIKAQDLADIVCQKVAELNIPHHKSSAADHVTISIGGVTLIPEQNMPDSLILIEQADNCLYQAKINGRNQVKWK
jgi:diguanylate cyclase (GGDEF)-like protein